MIDKRKPVTCRLQQKTLLLACDMAARQNIPQATVRSLAIEFALHENLKQFETYLAAHPAAKNYGLKRNHVKKAHDSNE